METATSLPIGPPTQLVNPPRPFPVEALNSTLADLALSEASISAAATVAASDTVAVTAGRQFAILCTVAGNVKVGFSGGGTLTFPVSVGLTLLPWRVVQVFVTGTTATATYSNLS